MCCCRTCCKCVGGPELEPLRVWRREGEERNGCLVDRRQTVEGSGVRKQPVRRKRTPSPVLHVCVFLSRPPAESKLGEETLAYKILLVITCRKVGYGVNVRCEISSKKIIHPFFRLVGRKR